MADQRPPGDQQPSGSGLVIEGHEVESTDGSRSIVTVTGHWQAGPLPGAGALLIVTTVRGRRRFSAFPQRPPGPGSDQRHFSVRFTVPDWLLPELDQEGVVAVGGHVVPLSARRGGGEELAAAGRADDLGSAARAEGLDPAEGAEPPSLVSPANELRRRAATEARLRGELIELRARLTARTDADVRMGEMREALRSELERVRELVGREDSRRAEVESRAMVLAAELADAQERARGVAEQLVAAQAETQQARSERDFARREVEDVRAETEAARALAQAAEAEIAGLGAELERLEGKLVAAETIREGRESGLEDAESLLAEARELNSLVRQH